MNYNSNLISRVSKQKMMYSTQSSGSSGLSGLQLLMGGPEIGILHRDERQEDEEIRENFKAITAVQYSSATSDIFFGQREYVKTFGLVSKMSARFGMDFQNKILKYYVRKLNFNSRPSVLYIIHEEMQEVITGLLDCLRAIDEGFETGNLAYKFCPLIESLRPSEKEFWYVEGPYGAFLTLSGTFRMRCCHKFGKTYTFVINNPNDSSSFPNFFGARITLNRPEVEQLITLMQETLLEFPVEVHQ